jgi:prepilin-type N-terminal cleavage/methylation domain-containing protein
MSRARTISESSSVSKGFSAIELLLVVVLLGVLAAIAIPFFNRMRRRSELTSAAMQVSTTLLAARMKAVRYNATTSVAVTPSSDPGTPNEFDTIEPPLPVTTPTPMPIANPMGKLLISGRAFRFVATPPGGIVSFDGTGRLVPPPAAPTPSQIVIEGPIGGPTNQITIETNSAGRVRIITPTRWQ